MRSISLLPAFLAFAALCCAPVAASPAASSTVERVPIAPGSAQQAPAAGALLPQPSPVGQMAHVPDATFRMGSEVGEPDEGPVHAVHVAAFDIDLTEVTVAQYAECVRAGACVGAKMEVHWLAITEADQRLYADECNGDRPDKQDHAVNCVDWRMADAYCRWVGKRLPTEEEWEYAACGGDCSRAFKADVGRPLARGAAGWPFTSRVARGRPGPFGLYDMAGNVWEWTSSPYCPYDHPACGDARRVVRGGSWSVVDYLFVRLTDRSPSDPSTRNTNLGFRCARSTS